MADHIEDTDLKKRHAKKGPRSLINEWYDTQSFLMFQDRLRSTVTVLKMKGSLEMKCFSVVSSHKLLLRVIYAEILNCFILLSPNIYLLAFHKLHAVFF